MQEQRKVDLEALDEREVAGLLADLFARMSAGEEYELRHEDYAMEMPQSGERIRGRENMRRLQEAYPNPPSIRLRRVVVRDGLWILEAVSDYGAGRVFSVVAVFELKDGRIWRDTRYYAEPFEAPEWRARWVERIGEVRGPRAPGGEKREAGDGEGGDRGARVD